MFVSFCHCMCVGRLGVCVSMRLCVCTCGFLNVSLSLVCLFECVFVCDFLYECSCL